MIYVSIQLRITQKLYLLMNFLKNVLDFQKCFGLKNVV